MTSVAAPEPKRPFWTAEYPGIRSLAGNLAAIRASGYDAAGHFVLPDNARWEPYCRPILAKLPALREKYRTDPAALAALDRETVEIDLFRKYSAYYGYVFFVMRRAE